MAIACPHCRHVICVLHAWPGSRSSTLNFNGGCLAGHTVLSSAYRPISHELGPSDCYLCYQTGPEVSHELPHVQAVGMSLCPESPVWLSWYGRHQLAAASYSKLHGVDSPGAVGTGQTPAAGDAEEPLLAGSVVEVSCPASCCSQQRTALGCCKKWSRRGACTMAITRELD